MKRRLMAALCAAALVSTPSFGADDGTDAALTTLKEMQHFVVQQDGSYVETIDDLVQVNEERALAGAAQRQFHFNRTVEDVEIVEAWNEKPDGRRIPVLPGQIKLQQEPAYSGAPMFQDMQIKTLIYSDVAVGDKLYSKTRRTRRVAVYAGQFSDLTMPRYRPTKQLTLIYDLPSTLPLKVDNLGFKAADTAQHDGRTVYRWDYVEAANPRLEDGAVSYWDFGRHLLVSTFADYATLARAYDRTAAPAAAPSPRVEAKARELVQGLSDPRAKAYAIDNWVRKNIRYVAVYIGNGGVVPHAAEIVMDNRYGDCKDHATLMEAMLRAVGIESTPVLINAGNAYKLAAVASPYTLDHAITYVPSLDLYLDSTAASIAPGYLPTSELDKDVILTRSATIGHTPRAQPGQVRNRFAVQIAADGSARFEFTRDQQGWKEEVERYNHRNWKKADRDRYVESVLDSVNIKGSGDVELGDLSEQGAGKGYRYTLRGTADNWVYLPGTVGVPSSSSLVAGMEPHVFGLTSEAKRTQPYVCPEYDYEEEATYTFPQGATLLVVPPNVDIASPYLQYHSEFRREAGKLVIARRFKSGKAGSRVCTPDDHLAMQDDIRKMIRDLRSQFILQVPETANAVAAAVTAAP
jgi:transglutaminase-like putative cysteine protease